MIETCSPLQFPFVNIVATFRAVLGEVYCHLQRGAINRILQDMDDPDMALLASHYSCDSLFEGPDAIIYCHGSRTNSYLHHQHGAQRINTVGSCYFRREN